MKRMKQVLAVLTVVVLTSSFANAQRLGLKGGLNVANMKFDVNSIGLSLSSKAGIHLGGVLELPLTDEIYAQGGVMLSSKGLKIDNYYKMSLTYLDIPLNALYKYELNDFSIYGLTGPTIGFGVTGKYKYDNDYEENFGDYEIEDNSVEWGNDANNDDFKRLDLGWSFGAGVEINEVIQVGLSYTFGIANISSYTQSGYSAKNRIFQISVAYMLDDLDLF